MSKKPGLNPLQSLFCSILEVLDRCILFRIERFGNSPHSPFFLSGKLFGANEFNITNTFKVYIVKQMTYIH